MSIASRTCAQCHGQLAVGGVKDLRQMTRATHAEFNDIVKCQLKPLNRSDNYGPVPFTDQQWAQVQTIFPDGVCDFSKPGVAQRGTVPWMTYQDAQGNWHEELAEGDDRPTASVEE